MSNSRKQDVTGTDRDVIFRPRAAPSVADAWRVERIEAASQDGFWEWDVAAAEIKVSTRWCAIAGLSPVVLCVAPERLQQCLHPDDRARVAAHLDRLVGGGAGADRVDLDHRVVHPDGTVVRVMTRAAVTRRDEQGRAALITGVLTDLAPARHVEEPLCRERAAPVAFAGAQAAEPAAANRAPPVNDQKHRMLFEALPDAVLFFRADTGRLLAANAAACALYGCSEAELLRLTIDELVAEPGARAAVIRTAVDGELQRMPNRLHRRKDGVRFPVDVSAGSFVLDGQRVCCGIVRDVSHRTEAESALARSGETYRRFFDNIGELVLLLRPIRDAQGRLLDLAITDANAAAAAFLGSPAGSLAGQRATAVFGVDLMGRHLPLMDEVMTLRERREADVPFRGAEFRMSFFPLDEARIVITAIDITDRKRAEARVLRLSRVQAVLGGINYAIAHCADRQDLLDSVCRVAVVQGGFKLAWTGMVAPDGTVKPVAAAGETAYLKGIRIVTDGTDPAGRGPVGTAIRENRPVLIDDIAADDCMQPWRLRASRHGLHYVAAFPLRMGARVVGSFQAYAPSAGYFDRDELELLTQISDDISFALASIDNEQERRRIEGQLRLEDAALAAAANGIVIVGADGRIVWVNEAFTTITGYALEEVRNQNPRVLKSGQHDAAFYRGMWQTILSGAVWRGELVNRRRNGGLYHEDMTITPVRDAGGVITHFIAIKQDITGRKRMEHDLLTARDREQERIGRDLHDGLCQVLTGAKFRTGLLAQKLRGTAPPEACDATEIETLLDQAIRQARGVAYGLNPVRPEPGGLVEALEQLAMSVTTADGPHCVCRASARLAVPDRNTAIQLYRIAQEAVQNAVKHSGARNVAVTLRVRAGVLTLAIADDGTGFQRPASGPRGTGLHNMRARAESIGGVLAVTSPESGGTTIACRVRLAEGREKSS